MDDSCKGSEKACVDKLAEGFETVMNNHHHCAMPLIEKDNCGYATYSYKQCLEKHKFENFGETPGLDGE